MSMAYINMRQIASDDMGTRIAPSHIHREMKSAFFFRDSGHIFKNR